MLPLGDDNWDRQRWPLVTAALVLTDIPAAIIGWTLTAALIAWNSADYPRWYLARTLADLALEILRGRGASAERGGQIQGPGWEPPGDIQPYLETASRTTPATFSRQLDSAQVHRDPEAESVIEYLELYMESSNEH